MFAIPVPSRWMLAAAFVVAVGTCAVPVAAVAAPGPTMRVSVSGSGVQGGVDYDGSQLASISDDGRFVAFLSDASNIVTGGTGGTVQVFVHDRLTGKTTLVSKAGGAAGNDASGPDAPAISGDGRFIAFESFADNLVPADSNDASDIFVYEISTGKITRASVDASGSQFADGSRTPSISTNGGLVVFAVGDEAGMGSDVFVRDTVKKTTTLVSATPGGVHGNGWSGTPSVSRDGRFVAFSSEASDLVTGDTNARSDIFVRDLAGDVTTRVSVGPTGAQADGNSARPSISAAGGLVAFESDATNLVAGDSNEASDIFVHDRATHLTTCVSLSPSAEDAYLGSYASALSADGSYVAFESEAAHLIDADTNDAQDIFVRDLGSGTTSRVSVSSGGAQTDFPSFAPSIALDGTFVAFDSSAPLVDADTNAISDVFVKAVSPVTTTLSLKASGSSFRLNKYVTLTGALHDSVPVGSHVRYEVRLPHKSAYKTVSSTRNVAASGASSSYKYKLTKKGTYYFRARFMGVTGFLASTSKTIKVVVK